jgi:hypothetical protein
LLREKSNDSPNIRNVWVENFEVELPIISDLLDKFPYVAMVSILLYCFQYNVYKLNVILKSLLQSQFIKFSS